MGVGASEDCLEPSGELGGAEQRDAPRELVPAETVGGLGASHSVAHCAIFDGKRDSAASNSLSRGRGVVVRSRSPMSNEAPIAVVAGVSFRLIPPKRLEACRSGWVIQVLPGQEHGHGNLMHIWQRVLRYGDEHADRVDAGVHFLLAHDREDERPAFRRELRGRSFRAVWLPKVLSTQYGSTDFREAIDDLLEFEEQWGQRLRSDFNSPLLLPESAFEADPNVRDTWIRAHNVVVDHDNIDAVDVSIRRFVGVHRKGPGLVDARKLLFNKGAPHGEQRRWRVRRSRHGPGTRRHRRRRI